jgi:hypothetical protein
MHKMDVFQNASGMREVSPMESRRLNLAVADFAQFFEDSRLPEGPTAYAESCSETDSNHGRCEDQCPFHQP